MFYYTEDFLFFTSLDHAPNSVVKIESAHRTVYNETITLEGKFTRFLNKCGCIHECSRI